MKRNSFSLLFLSLLILSACARSGVGRSSFSADASDSQAEIGNIKKPYIDYFVPDEDAYYPQPEDIEAPEEELLGAPKSQVHNPNPTLEKPAAEDFKRGGIITPTIYFNPVYHNDDQTCKPENKVAMRDRNKNTLISVCPNVAKECGLQGSCTIEDKGKLRLFNILTRIDGKDVFFEMDRQECRYGYGVKSLCLVPYHTLAADLSIYKPGQVVYIPKLRGVKLPNGQKHSGYLVVRDEGRGVKGAGRFDFFTGFADWTDASNPFVKVGLGDKDTDMEFYLVHGESAKKALRTLTVSI